MSFSSFLAHSSFLHPFLKRWRKGSQREWLPLCRGIKSMWYVPSWTSAQLSSRLTFRSFGFRITCPSNEILID
jgi:hypothetical protein